MKKLTLFLSMMIALIGLNANAAMYIVGNTPFGNWNPGNGVEMTDADGDGIYSYVTDQISGTVWFVFADGLDSNWDEFNAKYRYCPTNGAQTVSPNVEYTTQKCNNGSNSYNFTGTAGEAYEITFNTNNNTFKITGYVAPFNPLTGKLFTLGQVNGNNWNPSTGIEMATTDENVFTLTDATITDSGDGYGYFSFTSKLGENADVGSFGQYRRGSTQDGFEAVDGVQAEMGAWGTSDAFKALPAIYDITVNLSDGYVLLTKKGDIVPETTDVYIFGDVNDFSTADGWDATKGAKMTETDGIYTAEVTANKREGQEYAYFGFTKKLAETNDSIGWASIAAYRFGPVSEGNFVMTEELLGKNCDLATDGSYNAIAIPEGTWTVTVDLVNHKFTINGEWPTDTITPEPEADVYILGDVDNIGWNATQGVKMTLNEGVYTANITTQNQGDLGIAYFGFTKKLAETNDSIGWASIAPFRFGPMSDGAFVMTEQLLGQTCELDLVGDYAQSIAIPEGTWTVTVNLKDGTFKIDGEWPTDTITPEGNVYIIGEVNDKTWAANDGVQMTFDEENNVYTATVTFDGRNTEGEEGAEELVNYFGLTKKLGANDQDWATLNANRLGSETDGNYWVTPEQMGKEIGLVCPIDMSYRIAKGEYTITVNLEKMTMVINQAGGLRGDVDNNQDVTIADVSALIDYLLTGDASEINLQNADCDLSGNGTPEVTIADVSALIDYLLNGEW